MKLVLNLKIKAALENIDPNTREVIIRQNWISHSDVIDMYKSCKFGSGDDLLDALKGSQVYIPPPEVSEQSEEFKENLERLRLKLEEEEYQNMVQSSLVSNYDSSTDQTPAQAAKELKHQLTTIVNILISVASVAYALWYWTGSSMHINNAYRVLICLFFSLLVLVAEVVVFNGYLNKLDEAKINERRKPEVKKVIDSVTFNSQKLK